MSAEKSTRDRIKRVIIESLHLEGMSPEMIDDDAPLFGEGLGLDSVDALELVVALEKEYGVRIDSENLGEEVFASVRHMAAFVDSLTGERAAGETAT